MVGFLIGSFNSEGVIKYWFCHTLPLPQEAGLDLGRPTQLLRMDAPLLSNVEEKQKYRRIVQKESPGTY